MSDGDRWYRCETDNISVELVDFAASQLHAGKGAGLDLLQTAHLTNSHPILYKILSWLYNIIMKSGFVHRKFGQGLLILIPKDASARDILKVRLDYQFCGIIISPVTSKVVEDCILQLYKPYLYTSDRQFGFKKTIGCNHAIFTVRKAIEYLVDNGSTVKCVVFM